MKNWNQFDAKPYIPSKGAAGYVAKYINKKKADYELFTEHVPFNNNIVKEKKTGKVLRRFADYDN